MLFQNENSWLGQRYRFLKSSNLNFQAHLHSGFELIVVTSGEMTVFVDGTEYLLKKNDCVLVFPNQVHEICSSKANTYYILIFSKDFVELYAQKTSANIPKSNGFHISDELSFALSNACEIDEILKIKGLLYVLCGEFDNNAEYIKRSVVEENILNEIFKFVEENFDKDCSLKSLSRKTGYHYVYLSKAFKSGVGISFSDYVSRYRVEVACHRLRRTSLTITQIAYESGFDSIRTFNRSFKAVTGVTPAAYRKSK